MQPRVVRNICGVLMIRWQMLARFGQDERGAAALEYFILLGLVTAGVVAGFLALGAQVADGYVGFAAWLPTFTNSPA